MTNVQLEAQIAKLQAELAASRSAANVETESLSFNATSLFGVVDWKKLLLKAVVAGGYGFVVGHCINMLYAVLGVGSWPLVVAFFTHLTVLLAMVYFVMITSGLVADFVVDTLPAKAVSTYNSATKWLGNAAATTKEFATEQYGRVVH